MATTIKFDLTAALAAIDTAQSECADIDKRTASLDFDQASGGPRRNDPDAAELARRLLRTTALLRTAAAECEMVYWQFKGYADPRFEDD